MNVLSIRRLAGSVAVFALTSCGLSVDSETSDHRSRDAGVLLDSTPDFDPFAPGTNSYGLYSATTYKWSDINVSVSYMPDGTKIGTTTSSLFRTYDGRFGSRNWQQEFARALQTWATKTPLNFHFVPDSGLMQGALGKVQGDARFGDIRFGAYPSASISLASAYFPSTNSTKGGDITLNASKSFNIGTSVDLYSVVAHEVGHALGLNHSTVYDAVMSPTINRVQTDLTADDVAGIQKLYGARSDDAFDAMSSNDFLGNASRLTLDSARAVTIRADLTTKADVDHYLVAAPADSDGSLAVVMDASTISLLIPKLSVFDSTGKLIATVSAATYGSPLTVNVNGTAGQKCFIQAAGATSDAFHVGGYELRIQFGGPRL